jgi:hypothetical protein
VSIEQNRILISDLLLLGVQPSVPESCFGGQPTSQNNALTLRGVLTGRVCHTVSPGGKRRSRAGLRWSGSNGVVKPERYKEGREKTAASCDRF